MMLHIILRSVKTSNLGLRNGRAFLKKVLKSIVNCGSRALFQNHGNCLFKFGIIVHKDMLREWIFYL
jgi:hypothetical protein